MKCFVRKLCSPTSLNRAYYFLINKNNELSFVLWQRQRCWWFFGVTSMCVCTNHLISSGKLFECSFLPLFFVSLFASNRESYIIIVVVVFIYFVQSVFCRGYSESNAFIIIYSFYIWLHKMPTTMTHIIVCNRKYESYDNLLYVLHGIRFANVIGT